LPLPPRVSLCPYTTLFRSANVSKYFEENYNKVETQELIKRMRESRQSASEDEAQQRKCSMLGGAGKCCQPASLVSSSQFRALSRDRKSTRLNSSHVSISYA